MFIKDTNYSTDWCLVFYASSSFASNLKKCGLNKSLMLLAMNIRWSPIKIKTQSNLNFFLFPLMSSGPVSNVIKQKVKGKLKTTETIFAFAWMEGFEYALRTTSMSKGSIKE